MTGLELANSVGADLRDRDHNQYSLAEILTYLKRGVRLVAVKLAGMGHPLACKVVHSGSPDWPAVVVPGQAGLALPPDYLATVSLFIVGHELLGPLGLVPMAQRFAPAGTMPSGYFLMGGAVGAPTLNLVPAPQMELTLELHYAALPEFVRLPDPADEALALAQLGQEVPFGRIFGEPLRQWVSLCCANRNEYDTTVEQGLWKLCEDQAQYLAAHDNLQTFDMGAGMGGDGNWGGR